MSELRKSGNPRASDLRPGLRATVAGLVSRALKRWHRAQAAAALHRLDDRQLEDIGVTRNDIARIVAGLVPSNAEPSQDTRILPPARGFGRPYEWILPPAPQQGKR
jgi:uncharacterized protein YjiS (DUF1127 family)